MPIPSASEYLTKWYNDWKQDLENNLAGQAVLQADEAKLRELIATAEQAFALLFPAPPAPTPAPEPAPAPVEAPSPAPEPAPEPAPPPVDPTPTDPVNEPAPPDTTG